MADFSFRLRFKIPTSEVLQIDSDVVELVGTAGETVSLSAGKPDTAIKDAEYLILKAAGYASEEDARDSGEQFRDYLSHTLARFMIGADFGDRAPKSGIDPLGLAMLERQQGRRVLHDIHGLMTFETSPQPVFARISSGFVIRGTPQSRFETAFKAAMERDLRLTEQQRLAYALFSISYFEGSEDARLVTLVMALETLITPATRTSQSLEHINHLIEYTKVSGLLEKERDSLIGSLNSLRKESIGAAGRRFVQEQLGDRIYMGMDASTFFSYCYGIRSRLVHGDGQFPSRQEVSSAAAELEGFVANILCGPLLKIDF